MPSSELAPLVIDDYAYTWTWDVICPPRERNPPPWRRHAPPPSPYERHTILLDGLQLVTWCALDDAGWRLRATLPSGVTEWIPPPRSATDAQGTHRDHYESLADVGEMALWLAIRWVRAHPRPRSIAALAGWDVVPVSDPRLTDLRAAYVAALWWSRAMTAFFNGVHTDDVERAETARAQALAAYQGAWHQLRREAVVAWQRRRDAEKRARGD